MVEQALVIIFVVWWGRLSIKRTGTGWLNIGEDIGWVSRLIAIEGPVLGGKGSRNRWREGTEVAIVVPCHIRRSGGRELILVWGLGSGGWVELEE